MIKHHNDNPTLADLLDRNSLVDELADAVANCDPPQVFAVHGDWGSGKTSFLHQLQKSLTGKSPQCAPDEKPGKTDHENVVAVWFEAWRYQNEAVPVVALLHEIRAQLPWQSRAKNWLGKMFDVTVTSALTVFEGMTKKIGIQGLSKIQGIGEKWEQDNLAAELPAESVRRQLEHALGQLLGTPPTPQPPSRRLVVFVDDLDRCEPDAAYRLLEGIKIYLGLNNCVFVLGTSLNQLERAIAKHLKAEDAPSHGRALLAREYLEKLCTHVWHLPRLSQPVLFMREFLSDEHAKLGTVLEPLANFNCLPANPRKLKAFAAVLGRFLERREARVADGKEGADREGKIAAVVACLYYFHPDIYRRLEADPRFYAKILDWCRNPPPPTPKDGEPPADVHEAFRYLQPTKRHSGPVDESTAVPKPELSDQFADPVSAGVFRVQSLVADFGVVEAKEIRPWLLTGKTDKAG